MELGSDRARLSSISTASRAKGRAPAAVSRGPVTSRKATAPDGARSEESESDECGPEDHNLENRIMRRKPTRRPAQANFITVLWPAAGGGALDHNRPDHARERISASSVASSWRMAEGEAAR